MKPEIESLIINIMGRLRSLKQSASTVSEKISLSYSKSGCERTITWELDTVTQALVNFFNHLDLLNAQLDGALHVELKNFSTEFNDALETLRGYGKYSSFDKVFNSIKLVEKNINILFKIADRAEFFASKKIAQLDTEVENNTTITDLTNRVAKLELELAAALAEIAKLKANPGQNISDTFATTPDKSATFFGSWSPS